MTDGRLNINVIYNPISGRKKKDKIITHLKNKLNGHTLSFFKTEYEGHAYTIANDLKNSSNIIVAVGGDGTVNEIGKALLYTHVITWIIPSGSGNGLARTLNIPMNYKKNINLFCNGSFIEQQIDVIKVDDQHSFVTCGLGMDALVAYKFKNSGRGLLNYIKIAVQSFLKNQNTPFKIGLGKKLIDCDALIVSVCNAGQYGNNFYISNQSQVNDGLLEVVVIKKSKNFFSNIGLLLRVLFKKLKETKSYHIYQCTEATVEHNSWYCHVDGEASKCNTKKSTFQIEKGALRTLCPPNS